MCNILYEVESNISKVMKFASHLCLSWNMLISVRQCTSQLSNLQKKKKNMFVPDSLV